MKKRMLAMLLSAAMTAGLMSGAALASEEEVPAPETESVTVSVTIAVKGEVALSRQEVTVTDADGDGAFTVNDALTAAHEAAYEGGAGAGYASAVTDWGLSITMLWGDESGSYGYWLNDASCWSVADPVAGGDDLVAFVYTDTEGYSDVYVRFVTKSCAAVAGEAVTVTLEAAGYDEAWNTVFAGCPGAALTAYDAAGAALAAEACAVTDNGDGTYGVVFAEPGEYRLAASKEDHSIVPAICEVSVKQALTDIAGHWAANSILFIHALGLTEGMDGEYLPEARVSRADLATALYRLDGAEAVGVNPFTDVPDGMYYTDAVIWANANGVIEGDGEGHFDPETDITREELVTMIYQYAQYAGMDTSAAGSLDFLFLDEDLISGWAVKAVEWGVGAGLVTGKPSASYDAPGNRFDPLGTTTRAEVATIIERLVSLAED